jgi:hypothetical protein
MIVNKYEIIKKIISMPQMFYENGNVSIYCLLKGSGYFEFYNSISEFDIFNELTQYPQYINYWLRLSEDKRTNKGWFFNKGENGKYIVGYFSENSNKIIEYTDCIKACAVFINNEIKEILTELTQCHT